MDKKLRFETKYDSNKRRDKETLKRTPDERMTFFFQLIEELGELYPKKRESINNNFILVKKENVK